MSKRTPVEWQYEIAKEIIERLMQGGMTMAEPISLLLAKYPYLVREEAHCLLHNLERIRTKARELEQYPDRLTPQDVADLRRWVLAIRDLIGEADEK